MQLPSIVTIPLFIGVAQGSGDAVASLFVGVVSLERNEAMDFAVLDASGATAGWISGLLVFGGVISPKSEVVCDGTGRFVELEKENAVVVPPLVEVGVDSDANTGIDEGMNENADGTVLFAPNPLNPLNAILGVDLHVQIRIYLNCKYSGKHILPLEERRAMNHLMN